MLHFQSANENIFDLSHTKSHAKPIIMKEKCNFSNLSGATN
uniref:Uncharacterized protein n=1 Tax=Rhizophora mucronata TaxID=61149 RepID=A0A2P2Q3R2_RHIMU